MLQALYFHIVFFNTELLLHEHCFRLMQSLSASEVNKEGTRSTKTDIVLAASVLVEVTRRSLYFTPRSTTVLLNLSRETKTFSCLLTSLPYQQVS